MKGSGGYEAMHCDASGAYESRKDPVDGSRDEEQSELASDVSHSGFPAKERGPSQLAQYLMCCLVCAVAAIIWALFVGIHITLRQWECNPLAPNSTFGEALFPVNFTLEETPLGALSSFWYGPTVNVLQGIGAAQGFGASMRLIGFFCEVWAWPGQAYGYIESTPQGMFLRFKATRPWHWFFQAPPWTIEMCSQAGLEHYQVQRAQLFDGAKHNLYKSGSGDERLDVGVAEHETNDMSLGTSLFADAELNIQWRLIYKAPPPHSATILAEARQWFDRSEYTKKSTSTWAVKWVETYASLPQGVEPLPGSVVAFTAALYDLTVGSSRRRRSHHRQTR